ncbi:MAG: type II CAAX endopeptidase family protein [Lachnospiraceae bacterium]|nr:type II CAAX endopeptidase family protein [Lachnospiraceae bacterium]MDY5742555.1 type II CAAX endopeptidase family protein [Lachnospiraceae bacterium]
MKNQSYNYFRPKLELWTNVYFLVTVVIFLGLSPLLHFLEQQGVFLPITIQLWLPQLFILGAGLLYKLLFRVPKRALGYRKMDLWSWFLMIPLTWCFMPLIGLINFVSRQFVTQKMVNVMQGLLLLDLPYLLLLFLIAVMPAISEELFFRGVLANVYLRPRGILKASLLSGLLFGAFHLNINQFMYATVLGIIFVFVLEGTGSLYATMLSHFLLNGQSVTLLALLRAITRDLPQLSKSFLDKQLLQEQLNKSRPGQIGVVLLMILFLLALSVLGCWLGYLLYRYICKRNHRWEHVCRNFNPRPICRSASAGSRLSLAVYWSAMLIMLLVMILREVG